MDLSNFVDKFSGYSESYKFYKEEVELMYDKDNHVYLLVEGEKLTPVPSVTTIIKKAVDKSEILIPWGCKMLIQKALTIVDPIYWPQSIPELETLLNRSKNAHKEKLDDAGTVGNIAHNWIEQVIKYKLNPTNVPITAHDAFVVNIQLPVDTRAASACKAAIQWMNDHNVRWISTERKIYSRIHRYAGTLDGLALTDSCNDPLCCPKPFNNRKSLIDWKTSNDLYLDYLFQIGAYWGAFTEMEAVDNPNSQLIEDGWVIRLGKDDAEFDPWHVWDVNEFELYYYGFLNARKWFTSMEYARTNMNQKNEQLREARKAQRQQLKEEQLKLECKGFSKYKGVRKPTCGCRACWKKYNEMHLTSDVLCANIKSEEKC